MRLQLKVAPWALVLVLGLLADAAVAQIAETPATVQSALQELKDAPKYERGAAREAVVGFAQEAVDPLIAEVGKRAEAEDVSFICNCIIALGELKAQGATDVLVDALTSANMQVVYVAAEALGDIGDGQGATDPAGKRINAAILALLYSDIPPEAVYGPGVALVKINRIPVQRPASLSSDELIAEIDTWAAANSSALPPVDQQPWQLNLRAVLTSRDAASRQAALAALLNKRALASIEPILDVLAEGAPTANVRPELAGLLGQLTGEPFPPGGAAAPPDPGDQVAAWRERWLARLKKQTDKRHTDYAWAELERSLRWFHREPNDPTAERVQDYRTVLLYQLTGPEGIPADASAKAKELLSTPLDSKGKISKAFVVLLGSPRDFEKTVQLNIIDDELRTDHGREVGLQFLGNLVTLARDEQNDTVAVRMGNMIWLLSGIPLRLDGSSLEQRRDQLGDWMAIINRIGLPLEISGQ